MTQPSSGADTKVCSNCGVSKPVSAFSRYSARSGGGVRSQCRPCRNNQSKQVGVTGTARPPAVRIPPVPHLPGPAACRNTDPELFFPTSRGAQYATDTRKAKKVCASCLVRSSCGAWALDHGEHGVWGGLDDEDRRAIREAAA